MLLRFSLRGLERSMRNFVRLTRTVIAGCLATILSVPSADAAPAFRQQDGLAQQSQTTPAKPQDADHTVQPGGSQDSAEQPQSGGAKPVGTAAAPYERTAGVAASKPAGAVIAPAKQRRARSLFIKVSIVAGACIAIGTVAGLSHASPSHPQ